MATSGPKKSIMQILEEDAARKMAKNPNSKFISEILQEDAAQHSRYQNPQMKDQFHGGIRHPGPSAMKIDYNHQRLPSTPMFHPRPPPLPPMGPCPPYHHPLPPNSGMYPPLPPQPMHTPMPPQPIPPQPMPPQPMPPHHPHMPPPMPPPPPPYPHMPPYPVHYMQPPVPQPVVQNQPPYQHMPPLPVQKPLEAPPAPPPALLAAPPQPDAPPLPPLPPSEPPLPPPPKEPPPPSPIKKLSVKHVIDSKSATVGLAHNHKKRSSDSHSPNIFNTQVTSTSIPTIPLTSIKTIPRSSTPMSEARHSSSPQMSKSSPTTTQSLPNQSHYSSCPPMTPSASRLNLSHPPHPPGSTGNYYHAQPPPEDMYDPEEAMFSPSSSTDESPSKEQTKQEDSLIDKYVRDFTAKSSTKSSAFSESLKSPSKKVSFAPDTKKESPIRIDLDSRLKLMFGGGTGSTSKSTEDPQGRKKDPVKMPVPLGDRGPSIVESVPVIQTGSIDERPLSPPPSPFLSKEIYLYWHKETIRVRKASKHSTVDFVTAGSSKAHRSKSRSHESEKGFELRANGQQGSMPPPPPPKNFLPTVPPPSYKKLSQDDIIQGRNLKADSSLKNSSTVQYHPYKRTVDKTDECGKSISKSSDVSNVNNNGISNNKHSTHNNSRKLSSDSELELTCQNSKSNNKTEQLKPIDKIVKNENKVVVNTVETKNVPASDSFLKAKTVGLVMSRVLAELRQTIRQELVKKLLDDNIMDTTDSGVGS